MRSKFGRDFGLPSKYNLANYDSKRKHISHETSTFAYEDQHQYSNSGEQTTKPERPALAMASDISTGTICPYPFTFTNKSSNDLSSCTLTYGEALDPGLLIQQVVFSCFFGLVALPIFVRRLYLTVLLARQRRKRWYESSQSKLYLAVITMSISVVVELIDPYGVRNVAPPYLYFIADGFFAFSLLLIAFFFVDFYMTTAKRANFQQGLSSGLMLVVVALTFINFIVFQIIAFIVPEYYEIFEGIKFLGAFLLAATFIVVAIRARASILEVLLRSGVEGDTSLRAAFGCGAASDFTNSSQRSVLTVKRKFAEYFAVMTIGMIAALVFGLLRLGLLNGDRDYQWERKLEDQPGISFTIFRVVGVLAVVVAIRTFKIPKTRTSSATDPSYRQDLSSKQPPVTI